MLAPGATKAVIFMESFTLTAIFPYEPLFLTSQHFVPKTIL